jgi:hypothetical protein
MGCSLALSNPAHAGICYEDQLLTNADFDLGPGGGWIESGAGIPIISSLADPTHPLPIPPHTGDYAGWMGLVHSATRAMYQDISIPAWTTALRIDGYRLIVTEELVGIWDVWTASIRTEHNDVLETLGSFDNEDQNRTWIPFSFPTSGSYADKVIRIYFENTNDSANITNFFVDSFEVIAIVCSEIIFADGFEQKAVE